MKRGLSCLKNIVYRLFYKLNFLVPASYKLMPNYVPLKETFFEEGRLMKIECGNDCIQYFEKQNKGLRLRFSMCFLQKNCTRINTFMYNIWQQISIYKVNTTFNTFWLCNLKLPCLVVGSSFDSYIIM